MQSNANIAAERATAVSLIDTPFLQAWRWVDVYSTSTKRSNPVRFRLALGPEGGGLHILTGERGSVETTFAADHLYLDTAERVAAALRTSVDVAHDFRGLQTVLTTLEDAPFAPPTGEARTKALSTYGRLVTAVAPTLSGGTWSGSVWTTLQSDLVRHDLTLTQAGAMTWQTTTVASGLPVAIGL